MKKAAMIMDEGFEELEAMGPIALLRRAGLQVDLVSAANEPFVKGRFGDTFTPATPMKDYDFSDIDALIIPGGAHYVKLEANPAVLDLIRKVYDNDDQYLCAICAAPTILGRMGLLKDKDYTCFVSMNEDFGGRFHPWTYTVTDGKLITAKSAAAAIDFGFAIMQALIGPEATQEVKDSIYYQGQSSNL